jgi:hypothetical protein
MGKTSVEHELEGVTSAEPVGFRPEKNFQRALAKANTIYLFGFDREYFERQEIWAKLRLSGLVDLSHPWSEANPPIESE